ncbi:MAG: hypothetical protein DHS20C05_18230 [Hyphococcus sp.]|nr:MAG: hypothetical protein DHS20C05_18230 [Marinicaulis sp.]
MGIVRKTAKLAASAIIVTLFSIPFTVLTSDTDASSAHQKSNAETQPRRPISIGQPTFPRKCAKGRTGSFEAYVVLDFDIVEDGRVKNISVVEATEDCFIEAAIAQVSNWKFKPPLINGEPGIVFNEQQRVKYVHSGVDANNTMYSPITPGNSSLVFKSQKPPSFPEECIKGRTKSFNAYVDLVFDVTAKGKVENVQLLETDDECFVNSAITAISGWKYKESLVNGKRDISRGEKIRVKFRFPGSPEEIKILDVKTANRLQPILEKVISEDYVGALADLDKFLAEERDSLKSYDLATVLEFRGGVKMQMGDFDGAIADFEDALATSGFSDERAERLEAFILEIKAHQKELEADEDG